MCKNPNFSWAFETTIWAEIKRFSNTIQTIFKSKPLRQHYRSGLFMQQPFQVSRGNYPLSFVCLASILTEQNLSRIVDKVVRVWWTESVCKVGKCSDKSSRSAHQNHRAETPHLHASMLMAIWCSLVSVRVLFRPFYGYAGTLCNGSQSNGNLPLYISFRSLIDHLQNSAPPRNRGRVFARV